MKAEDTVTDTDERNCYYTLEERLQEQAVISFKDGIKEVIEWIQENGFFVYYGLSSDLGRKKRIMWQAKLKEWGV